MRQFKNSSTDIPVPYIHWRLVYELPQFSLLNPYNPLNNAIIKMDNSSINLDLQIFETHGFPASLR